MIDDYITWRQRPKTDIQAQLRSIMADHELTGSDVGRIVGVDGRTVRRWLQSPEQNGYAQMPYAVWYTLVSVTE